MRPSNRFFGSVNFDGKIKSRCSQLFCCFKHFGFDAVTDSFPRVLTDPIEVVDNFVGLTKTSIDVFRCRFN